MKVDALIFDFDGVLIESEWAGNKQLAEYLTGIGHPMTPGEAASRFMGLAGQDFIAAIEGHIGSTLPDGYYAARRIEDARALAEGVGTVAGAVSFVRALPPSLPRAIASSSSTAWIRAHLAHIGLSDAFGDLIFSGREHVARGKPAPDLYWHAAAALGMPIARCAIIEDSVVGATGPVASGAYVIGLTAGRHCDAAHAERLRAVGVDAIATGFDDVAALLAL